MKKTTNLNLSNIDFIVIWIGVFLLILSKFLWIGYIKFYLIGTFLVLFGLISTVNRKASFLKPDKKRIAITVILSIILFVYSLFSMVVFCPLCEYPSYSLPWEICSCHHGEPDSLTSIMIAVYPLINFIGGIMFFIVTPYLILCLMFWTYNEIKKMKGRNKYYSILGIIIIVGSIALFINSLLPVCTYTQEWRQVSDNETTCKYYQETFPISKERIKWENEACWEYFDVTSCKETDFSNNFNNWRINFNAWIGE